MKILAWAIRTSGLAGGYELTKSPARVREARESGQTVVELEPKQEDDSLLEHLSLPIFNFEAMQKRWIDTP